MKPWILYLYNNRWKWNRKFFTIMGPLNTPPGITRCGGWLSSYKECIIRIDRFPLVHFKNSGPVKPLTAFKIEKMINSLYNPSNHIKSLKAGDSIGPIHLKDFVRWWVASALNLVRGMRAKRRCRGFVPRRVQFHKVKGPLLFLRSWER